MFYRTRTRKFKFIAGFMALLLLLGWIPARNFVTAVAATIDSYTITLTDGSDVIAIDGVEITITDSSDETKTKTEQTSEGIATFNDFIEEDVTYTVSIAIVNGYDEMPDFEITPSLGDKNSEVMFSAKADLANEDHMAPIVEVNSLERWTNSETVMISGKVKDVNTAENPSAGLDYIVWSKNTEMATGDVLTAIDNKVSLDSSGLYSFDIADTAEQDSVYFIYAVDIAKNISEAARVNVGIDRKKPSITGFTYSTEADSVKADDIGFFKFGTFYKKNIYVTVNAKDKENEEDISSGLKQITLYQGTEKLQEVQVPEGSDYVTFTLTMEDFTKGTEISAVVEDNAGNVSGDGTPTKPTDAGVTTQAKSNVVKINSGKPTVEIAATEEADYKNEKDGRLWYNGNTALKVEAKDSNTGIKKVEVNLNNALNTYTQDKEGNSLSEVYTTAAAFTVDITQEGENVLEAVVENNAGSRSEKQTQKVYIDTKEPEINRFEIRKVNGESVDKLLYFLTFGTFFNEKVEVTVIASDLGSGVKSITLYADGEKVESKAVLNAVEGDANKKSATFMIPLEEITEEKGGKVYFNKKISATAEDNVGNAIKENVEPTTKNSDIKNSGLMIETVKPAIKIRCEDAKKNKYEETTGRIWYDSDVEFLVTAQDENSGLRNVRITVNGTEIKNEDFNASDASNVDEVPYTVNTTDAVRAEDGSYKLAVTVTDNAGNVSEDTRTIYKDTNEPYITAFDFEPANFIEGNENASTVEETDYGFYFKADTKVTVSAADDGPTAGINFITYYTVDKNTGKSAETAATVNGDGKIEFIVQADFKGQIYARATDNVGNATANFVNPNGVIVESESMHNTEQHIAFAKEETNKKTAAGGELYAKDVPVTIFITDTYSGIREIEWSVTAPYDSANNQSGSAVVDNAGNVSDGSWIRTKTNKNLVTEMQKTVTVRNNSNDIVLHVSMTDRAGNTSERNIAFSIDKTAPVIDIVYDNNTPDDVYNDIFKENRTATVTITERNFNSKDVIYAITNTDGVIPSLSTWEEHRDWSNPDAAYYTATVYYSADGDYTFDISYADLAGNAANTVVQHAFTIDKTMPVVSVSYNNRQALNGNYYKEDRTATITITEHNFDASRVQVIGTATDNNTPTSFPAISSWTDNGDIHVATIAYTSDAKYSFDIEFLDKAGNSMADYAPEEFYVDKTAPAIEISGVTDKSANKGEIAPVITYTDTNFNKDTVSITLSGINNGLVDYSLSSEDIANGQRFTYANFDEKDSKVDDIYTLTATLTDMAGNETTQTISFSANRFGSVYNLSNVTDINGRYLKEEKDIVFEEVNVDELTHDSIKIKLIKNENPSDLVEGRDYTIDASGGNGQWSIYKYTIGKKLFADDGSYRVMVYSEDAAGNINENIEETKKADIRFGVDKTAPLITPVDFESGIQYPVEEKEVSVEIKDNLVLEEAKIYLNGTEIAYEEDGDTYVFRVPESNEKQTVRIVAIDAAGNEKEMQVEDFLVSTNVFARWYNNTPLFIGSIIGVVVLGGGIIILILFGKRKTKEAKP